jgi:tRNA dimethylallyltransferase
MKVYRELQIGTAKPPLEDRGGVRWHGLDLRSPWESFSAKDFRTLFDTVREEAARAGRPVLLSGGTMLYLKAATEGLGDVPPRDAAIRDRLCAEADEGGSHALHERLAGLDPATAEKVHPNDLRRIVRGLEVHELTGRPLSSFHGQFGSVREGIDLKVFVVQRERADMDQRINTRVDRMLAEGWIEECRRLKANAKGLSKEAGQAIGYRQIFEWLETGESGSLDELATLIKTATRRFARKQLTWLRSLKDANQLHVAPGEDPVVNMELVLSAFK